ncbi:hypothetical protein [Victivallis sp. Marseille-Q1083]|uniref:hypothetical protein n=1 Tax=Victivallis sp. Marseille-Q1083 TaxID=2717288 RepID=UPI001589F8D3|nr:hypothetical protein [Victivallis sp. Marseille-Q1083]
MMMEREQILARRRWDASLVLLLGAVCFALSSFIHPMIHRGELCHPPEAHGAVCLLYGPADKLIVTASHQDFTPLPDNHAFCPVCAGLFGCFPSEAQASVESPAPPLPEPLPPPEEAGVLLPVRLPARAPPLIRIGTCRRGRIFICQSIEIVV